MNNYENSSLPTYEYGALRSDPVFQQAFNYQMELNEQPQSTPDAARRVGNRYVAELARRALPLTQEFVTLTGDDIYDSKLRYNSDISGLEIKPVPIKQADRTYNSLSEPALTGRFFGFSQRQRPAPTQGEGDEQYLVVIDYQLVKREHVTLPSYVGPQLMFGAIESSELEFIEDIRTARAQKAKEPFMDARYQPLLGVIEKIDQYLSDNDRYTPYRLGLVSRLIHKYITNNPSQITSIQRDALLDLIKARLGLEYAEKFTISSQSSLEYYSAYSDSMIGRAIKGEVEVEDVSFTPHYYQDHPRSMMNTEEDTISLVVSQFDKDQVQHFISVPFEKIQLLRPNRGRLSG